jgi:hypothetical protein
MNYSVIPRSSSSLVFSSLGQGLPQEGNPHLVSEFWLLVYLPANPSHIDDSPKANISGIATTAVARATSVSDSAEPINHQPTPGGLSGARQKHLTFLSSDRDCPQPPKERACYRCGMTGHLSRECPQGGQGGAPGGFGGAPGGQECYKCGQVGHIARNCSQGGGYGGGGYGGGYGQRPQTCYSCGGFGHMARDCTQGQKCYNCSYPPSLARCKDTVFVRLCFTQTNLNPTI